MAGVRKDRTRPPQPDFAASLAPGGLPTPPPVNLGRTTGCDRSDALCRLARAPRSFLSRAHAAEPQDPKQIKGCFFQAPAFALGCHAAKENQKFTALLERMSGV